MASSRSRHSRSPSPRRRTPSRSRSRTPEHLYSILVTNLTRNVKEEHVKEIFSQYGTISRIEFPMNKRLNTNCGKAYIDYGTQEDADKALSYMDDAQLDGKRIVCTVAPSRRSRSPSPKPRSRSPIRRGGGRFGDASPPPFRRRSSIRSHRRPDRFSGSRRGSGAGRRYSRSISRSPPPRRISKRRYSYSRSPSPRGRSRSYSPPPRRNSARRSYSRGRRSYSRGRRSYSRSRSYSYTPSKSRSRSPRRSPLSRSRSPLSPRRGRSRSFSSSSRSRSRSPRRRSLNRRR